MSSSDSSGGGAFTWVFEFVRSCISARNNRNNANETNDDYLFLNSDTASVNLDCSCCDGPDATLPGIHPALDDNLTECNDESLV